MGGLAQWGYLTVEDPCFKATTPKVRAGGVFRHGFFDDLNRLQFRNVRCSGNSPTVLQLEDVYTVAVTRKHPLVIKVR